MTTERMNGATFRVIRESLGFTGGSFAEFAGVPQKRVSAWDNGKSNLPPRILELLRECEHDADTMVAELLATLQEHPAPTMQTYRNDASYRDAEPDSKYPAAWHRMVAGRVWEQIPHMRINYI
ncbi:helix-turn-helix domain-containing protein [Nocardioides maradonensis]